MRKCIFYTLIILALIVIFPITYNQNNHKEQLEISEEVKTFLSDNFYKNQNNIPCGYQKLNYKNIKIGK